VIINSGNLQTIYRGFNAAFRDGFGQAPEDHMPLTLERPSMTRTEEYGWLGQAPGLRKWVGERVYRGIREHGYTIRNEKFEDTIVVNRDDIEDDHYGVYGPLFQELGRAAAAHPCELVYGALVNGFSQLCYDGQYFFDTDHPAKNAAGATISVSNTGGGAGNPWFLVDGSRMIKPVIFQRRRDYSLRAMNSLDDEHVFKYDEFRYGVDARCNVGYGLWQLAYGSKQALTAANFETAFETLLSMPGDEGRPMGVMPTHLFVGPSNLHEALEIVNAERLANGATNVWRGQVELAKTPWLK